MKFTKNQAIVILAGVIIWFILMVSCYGLGYLVHEYGHL